MTTLSTLEVFPRLKYKGGSASTQMETDEDPEDFDALITRHKDELKTKKAKDNLAVFLIKRKAG